MKNKILFIGLSAVLLLSFQNCGDVSFSSMDNNSSQLAPLPDPRDIQESVDVVGGHFDLDTATAVYADGRGTTNKHVHEYDDVNKTNVANFFALIGKGFDNIQDTIAPDQSFYIQVANGDLSPRVALEINGVAYSVTSGRHGPFSLSGVAGTTKLTSLRALVATDAITNKGLVATQTNCVRSNRFSADGRYRNGALIFQAIPSDRLNLIDPVLGVATSNEALLWEATIFWHEPRGVCR